MSSPDDEAAGEKDEFAAYGDDPTIADEEFIWRRVPPGLYLSEDGEIRVASGIFSDSTNPSSPMSADLASVAKDPTYTRGLDPRFGVMQVTAGELRAEGQRICRVKDGDNEAHVFVIGPKGKKLRTRLRKKARWALPPEVDVGQPGLGD